jgi:hypothetical protein
MGKKKVGQVQGVLFGSMAMPSAEELRNAIAKIPRGQVGVVAREIGANPAQMSQWKSGLKTPSYGRAVQLIGVLRERGLLE